MPPPTRPTPYLFSLSVRRRPRVVVEEPAAASVVPAVEDDAEVFLRAPSLGELPPPPPTTPVSFLFGVTAMATRDLICCIRLTLWVGSILCIFGFWRCAGCRGAPDVLSRQRRVVEILRRDRASACSDCHVSLALPLSLSTHLYLSLSRRLSALDENPVQLSGLGRDALSLCFPFLSQTG